MDLSGLFGEPLALILCEHAARSYTTFHDHN